MTLDRRSFVGLGASLAATALARPAAFIGLGSRAPGGGNDPLGVRADFPIVKDRVFLNSAYIAPIPRQVVAAGHEFLVQKATRPLDVGTLLRKCDEVRSQFARLINAESPDEIGLLFSTADGENVLASGLGLARGDNVVIDDLHYDTEFVLYRTLQQQRGVELRIARHRDGRVEASDFAPLVDRRTKLVSVAWVSHRNGFRHHMAPIAEIAHRHGALFYADAIQAVGTFPIDVRAAGVDCLCAGGYKWLLAGFGVAPFYVRAGIGDRIALDRFGEFNGRELPDGSFAIAATAKRFDYSSRAFGDLYTLGAGLEYLEKVGVAHIEAHTIARLARRLQEGLAEQGHRLFTPLGNRSGIVAFYTAKPEPEVRERFERASVDVTVRRGTVRIAAALFNNSDDIERCLEVTRALQA